MRSGALCTPLCRDSRAIGTTGFPPGTASPQVPQKASVLSTVASQLLQFGMVTGPVRSLRSYAGEPAHFNRRRRGMYAYRTGNASFCFNRDNPFHVYDRNVVPIALVAVKSLRFQAVTSWHRDCSRAHRLLRTLAAHFPACPASARRWVDLKENLLNLPFSLALILTFEMGHPLVAHFVVEPVRRHTKERPAGGGRPFARGWSKGQNASFEGCVVSARRPPGRLS